MASHGHALNISGLKATAAAAGRRSTDAARQHAAGMPPASASFTAMRLRRSLLCGPALSPSAGRRRPQRPAEDSPTRTFSPISSSTSASPSKESFRARTDGTALRRRNHPGGVRLRTSGMGVLRWQHPADLRERNAVQSDRDDLRWRRPGNLRAARSTRAGADSHGDWGRGNPISAGAGWRQRIDRADAAADPRARAPIGHHRCVGDVQCRDAAGSSRARRARASRGPAFLSAAIRRRRARRQSRRRITELRSRGLRTGIARLSTLATSPSAPAPARAQHILDLRRGYEYHTSRSAPPSFAISLLRPGAPREGGT